METFSSSHRLLRGNGFSHVINAEVMVDKCFKIFFVRNGEENSRLGIIAGKKFFFAATDRNHIKRIIRETFRQHSVKQCKLDIVVMVKRCDPENSKDQMCNLKAMFTRLEKLCVKP